MGLDWTIGGCVMLGIIANSWRRLFGYVAEAVTFDNVNDYLETTTGLGATDNKVVTFSLWVKHASATGVDQYMMNDDGTGTNKFMYFQRNGLDKLNVIGANSSGTTILNMTGVNDEIGDTAWHHILFSMDMSDTGKRFYYLDDVQVTPTWTTYTNENLSHSRGTWWICAFLGSAANSMNGDLSELFYTNEYIDISVEANRRKFITADGKPVRLGSNGSTPTDTQPLVYFKGDASVWNAGTNAGSGGNFTMTGAVTDSTNEPVELPKAVNFDGTNDYLSRGSALTVTDTKEVTYSFWIHIPTGGGKMIFSAQDTASSLATGIYLRQNSNALGDITFQCRNSANVVLLTHFTGTNPVITNDSWHHVMGSYDLLNTTGSLWINGVQDGTTIQTIVNGTIDFNRTFNTIGAYDSGLSPMNGDLAELYLTNEYIDLTVQANREKFISAASAPVDLGADGSTPTGTQPIIYYTGHAGIWNAGTNTGSGGDFTMTGAVTGSTNIPVELP